MKIATMNEYLLKTMLIEEYYFLLKIKLEFGTKYVDNANGG